jgi:hypothetical protein
MADRTGPLWHGWWSFFHVPGVKAMDLVAEGLQPMVRSGVIMADLRRNHPASAAQKSTRCGTSLMFTERV